jgi:hypothetical protein
MRKRDKKLSIAKETLYVLVEGKDLKAVHGGMSCTSTQASTAGGSQQACC